MTFRGQCLCGAIGYEATKLDGKIMHAIAQRAARRVRNPVTEVLTGCWGAFLVQDYFPKIHRVGRAA